MLKSEVLFEFVPKVQNVRQVCSWTLKSF